METGVLDVSLRLLAVLALVLANGFFVAAEFAIISVRKTRIDQLLAEGSRMARPVRRALNNPDQFIAATQLGITMASLGLGWIGEPALATLIEPLLRWLPAPISVATSHTIAVAVAFLVITALHIVLGELAPKTVALQYPEKTSLLVAKPTELFLRVFKPFIRALNGMGWAVVRLFGMKAASGHGLVHSEEELKMLVTASQEAGVLEEDEEQMLHRVFHFAEFTAAEMMLPRTEMAAVKADASISDVVDLVWRGRYTSLPVYRGELDDIVGIMLVPDLVRALASPPVNFSVAAIAREALNVPETMKADELLRQMRRHRTHQAIVIDEYGGTAGLVTFERVMERIVGELGGDFGTAASPIRQLPDGSAEIDGLALVTDINEQFALEIDEETFTTVGGYMLGRLGRRPKVGDTVEISGRTMRVEAVDGLRVSRVRII
ncbi:MAG TPA: hemolysin family protein [Vicinamibacterales bacterium]|nr:hemolysin family protein [Vicinamibacterales bacterium]